MLNNIKFTTEQKEIDEEELNKLHAPVVEELDEEYFKSFNDRFPDSEGMLLN